MCTAPFSTTRNKQSMDWKTSRFLTMCQKAISHIFADIRTPRARLRKPLSKDVFPTLEYRPKQIAGHLYGLAKLVTGGRTPKSKPSELHARTAASNSSIKGSRPDAAWNGGRHRKTPKTLSGEILFSSFHDSCGLHCLTVTQFKSHFIQ